MTQCNIFNKKIIKKNKIYYVDQIMLKHYPNIVVTMEVYTHLNLQSLTTSVVPNFYEATHPIS